MSVVTAHMVYFCAFARSDLFPKNARELGVGRGQFHSGVNGLNDLLNEHGNFYKFHEFNAKYNFDVPFTVFYGLIDAIPNVWKDN